MRPLVAEFSSFVSPESLVSALEGERGVVLLRSALFESSRARYSFVAARPFLTFRSFGSRCELVSETAGPIQFGNPWQILNSLMARYEMLEEIDLPFPLGGCFGCWGYDLKNFVEPRLSRRAVNDLELPDCHVGFYGSLVVFDHRLSKIWIVSTGLQADGSRDADDAQRRLEFWESLLEKSADSAPSIVSANCGSVTSTFSQKQFQDAVKTAQRYIRSGDIYQVNLSQRFAAACPLSGWDFFQRLTAVSPAPYSAFVDCGDFQVVSSSPELFLRISGNHVQTRPIKGTRPRSSDPDRDAQLTYELQTSAKEMAELVMITDLLRNDLGRVCEYGSVKVPDLVRLERYPQVQHLVSTVEGQLRTGVSHFDAFASCFPGGSITGAPKIRAMEIIDELEPVTRGPYTGSIGYLGFNRESQVNIAIRTAILKDSAVYFHAGAGIVADSDPQAEYDETLAKARGFFSALNLTDDASLSFAADRSLSSNSISS